MSVSELSECACHRAVGLGVASGVTSVVYGDIRRRNKQAFLSGTDFWEDYHGDGLQVSARQSRIISTVKVDQTEIASRSHTMIQPWCENRFPAT